MTLIDASLHIAAALLGAALLAVAFIACRHVARRRGRYQGRTPAPHAGFQAAARYDTGEQMRLECQGRCGGTTTHEADGDGNAACFWCGTVRPVPAHDEV
ncbi:hypothetical protein ACKI1J_15735 [Streptomyces scabiei]|uniref:hypothetical protein n=1 Tax=Streptomyces scabiei TaxID=1930 RepID=UPI0038F6386E